MTRPTRPGLALLRLISLILLYLLSTVPLWGAEFTGKVVGVSDGDTITVMYQGRGEKVRLSGIDCPEKGQAFGNRAKQFTSKMVFGRDVLVRTHGRDCYKRLLGEVFLPDGRSLNQELVRAGYAWWFRRYSDNADLKKLEEEARAAKAGLWVDPQAIPPWQYRRKGRQE